MLLLLKHKPVSSKSRETHHFAVVSSFFPELYVLTPFLTPSLKSVKFNNSHQIPISTPQSGCVLPEIHHCLPNVLSMWDFRSTEKKRTCMAAKFFFSCEGAWWTNRSQLAWRGLLASRIYNTSPLLPRTWKENNNRTSCQKWAIGVLLLLSCGQGVLDAPTNTQLCAAVESSM